MSYSEIGVNQMIWGAWRELTQAYTSNQDTGQMSKEENCEKKEASLCAAGFYLEEM